MDKKTLWETLTDWKQSPVMRGINRLRIKWYVHDLITALKDEDWIVRASAVEAIGKIAEKHPEYDWEAVVPNLITALKDKDSDVRKKAVEALGKIAEKHPEYDWEIVVPDLITALKDWNPHVRESAAEVLGKIGVKDEQFEMIVRMLKEGETKEERQGAAMALGELKNAKAVPDLITALKDEDWDVRKSAAEALVKIGELAVPDLITPLKDENSDVRKEAAEAIGKIAEGNPGSKEVLKAVPDLMTALKDKYRYVRYRAAEAIGKIGVNDEQFETIVRMLKEGETWWEREGAAMALGELKNAKAVPNLITALKDKDSDVRKKAVEALGKIAEKHPEYDWEIVVPDLITALKDEDWHVRWRAAWALEEIGFEKVPLDGRVLALLILKKIDDAVAIGEPAVPDLITALKDEDRGVRERAAEAIGKIGVNDEQFETIVRMLKEGETWWEREGAAMALGELKNVKAVPDLIAALKDKDWYVRWRTAEALEKIGFDKVPLDGRVLALLILEKTDEVVAMGEPAVSGLIAALKNEYWVRERAAWALEKIAEKLFEKPIALVEQFIEKGEFEEALETIGNTTMAIMKFYKGAFRTAKKENKTIGKDRILLKQREELLKKLDSLTNEVYARVKEKEGLPNPLDEKEPMEWKPPKRDDKKSSRIEKKNDNT